MSYFDPFGLRGLPTSESLAGDTRTLGYDNVWQIITLSDARRDLGFDNDELGLASLALQDFSDDANGNWLFHHKRAIRVR